MDADGSTAIEELERLAPVLTKGFSIAIGSRALKAEGIKLEALWYRKAMGRIFATIVNLLIVPGIRDTQCGFKLFEATAAKDIFSQMTSNRFSFDVELLFLARKRGYRIKEVAVNWHNEPDSKVNLLKDSCKMFLDIFKFRWKYLRGHYRR